jgi:hypothetical protein
MGRILLIHPKKSYLELVTRMLADWHEVETFHNYQLAQEHLARDADYEAVLIALEDAESAARFLEKAAPLLPRAQLIPVARDASQVEQFDERVQASPPGQPIRRRLSAAWLRENCSLRDLLQFFPLPELPPSAPALPPADEARKVLTPGDPGAPATDAVIDGYRLLCSIGEGGFGKTWMCLNETTERRMAIKFIAGEEQVCQELTALRKYVPAAKGNEHLIQVEHINQDRLRLWFVTPLADSSTGSDSPDAYRPLSLANLLQAKGHLPELQAVEVAISMGRGLAVLHEAGLVHGDVSPGNILRVRGRWVLADPSLVRFIGDLGICRNRVYYPDVKACRPRDDLYAMGVLLWEMVSGVAEMPSGNDRLRLDERMLAMLGQIEMPLAKVTCRAVAENPEQRYMNVDELLHDLESLAAILSRQIGPQASLYHVPKLRSLRTSGALPPLEGRT